MVGSTNFQNRMKMIKNPIAAAISSAACGYRSALSLTFSVVSWARTARRVMNTDRPF